MSRALWLLALLGACSHSEKTERADRKPATTPAAAAAADLPPGDAGLPRTVPPDPRYYAPADGPDPLACAADKDCIADSLVDTDRGCCVVAGDPMPQTWAWHAWVTEHRMSAVCHDARCQPVPMPEKLPRACLLEARCMAGRCQTSCSGDAGTR